MELIRQGDVYKYGDLAICPDPPEDVLVELYVEWKKTGVLDRTFYGEPCSLLWFLQWFSRKDASTLGAYHCVEASGSIPPGQHVFRPVGLIWINQSYLLPGGYKRAEVAMAFRRKAQPRILHSLAQMAIEWGFEQRGLTTLIGTTPVQNRHAVLFGKRLGFDVSGVVHGMATWHGQLTDVHIQSMDRDMWRSLSPFKENTASEAA